MSLAIEDLNMTSRAAAAKEFGNLCFKNGEFEAAINMYAKAEADEPDEPVYPSNISAAFYELGHYARCVSAVLRASRLIKDVSEEHARLVARLSVRLAKALCHGVRARTIPATAITARANSIERLRSLSYKVADDTAKATLDGVWAEWVTTRSEMDLYAQKRAASLSALSRLPMFCKPLDPMKEFFPIGTDNLMDHTEGLGPEHVDPKHPRAFAFLFGGVGDARHVMSSLCALSSKYDTFPADKQVVFHPHLTLIDIHVATIARDLCIFLLLGELAYTNDAATAVEIKATLMYVYCGVVMPSYCYTRLQALLRDLRRQLTSPEPDLPSHVHVANDTVPTILDVLELWIDSPKSTQKMLDAHQNMDNLDGTGISRDALLSSASPEFRKVMETRSAAKRQDIREQWLNLSDADLIEFGMAHGLTTVAEARNKVREDIESIVDKVEKLTFGGNAHTYEVNWYNILKVFLPPPELRGRHPAFSTAWTQVQKNGQITQSVKQKALDHIHNDWKPNITIFDRNCENPEYFPGGDGYPDTRVNMFDPINQLHRFNVRGTPTPEMPLPGNAIAWDVCSVFFDEVAAALKALDTRVTLEFICGGLHEELAKMRFEGDESARPKDFPKKFIRMWLSNVPDYTHGPLGTILYVLPNLQHDEQAAIASNSMMNMPVWKDDEEFMHTYTLLEIDDIELFFGCDVVESSGVAGPITIAHSMVPLPLPFSELTTRYDLTSWLTRVLFNTFLPGRTKPPPCNIRLPHNLVGFFNLLLHVHRVGYPGHWLSDFLARVLSGRMVSDVAPYNAEYPIPVSYSSKRVASRSVRTDPWLVEFETIIATAYYAIPFPFTAALPTDFSRDADDIALWQAEVRPATRFVQNPFTFCSPFEPVAQLLFYRSEKTSAKDVIGDMRGIFEGKATPAPGTFFFLTAQEYVQYQTCVRFRLSKKRVERMREEKWSMVVYRNDNGIQATLPVPIGSWKMLTSASEEVPTHHMLPRIMTLISRTVVVCAEVGVSDVFEESLSCRLTHVWCIQMMCTTRCSTAEMIQGIDTKATYS